MTYVIKVVYGLLFTRRPLKGNDKRGDVFVRLQLI